MTKIINLFGGPGCGKSTTRAGLFYKMRMAGKSVEELSEWVKEAIYEKRDIAFADQIFAFGNQEKSQNVLCGHTDYLLTDSPLALSCVYGRNRTETFEKLVIETFNNYNNINIFLERPTSYTCKGRNESLDEAKRIDKNILDVLDNNNIEYICIPTNEKTVDTIFKIINIMEQGKTIYEAKAFIDNVTY